MTAFGTWEEAHAHAQWMAQNTARPVGLAKVREYGRVVYVVTHLPKAPTQRFGRDSTCEVVNPNPRPLESA